jgi:hypothetical protein
MLMRGKVGPALAKAGVGPGEIDDDQYIHRPSGEKPTTLGRGDAHAGPRVPVARLRDPKPADAGR